MSDENTRQADSEQEDTEQRLRRERLCHICRDESFLQCECGDFFCLHHYNHCYAKDCNNNAFTWDEHKHPYCREHKQLVELKDEPF